jgi:predicted ATPase
MIDKIKLKSGSSKEQPNLEFDATPITIFVGPNNSGKSLVLIEIEKFCRTGYVRENDLILEKLKFIPLRFKKQMQLLEEHSIRNI